MTSGGQRQEPRPIRPSVVRARRRAAGASHPPALPPGVDHCNGVLSGGGHGFFTFINHGWFRSCAARSRLSPSSAYSPRGSAATTSPGKAIVDTTRPTTLLVHRRRLTQRLWHRQRFRRFPRVRTAAQINRSRSRNSIFLESIQEIEGSYVYASFCWLSRVARTRDSTQPTLLHSTAFIALASLHSPGRGYGRRVRTSRDGSGPAIRGQFQEALLTAQGWYPLGRLHALISPIG